MTSSSGLGTPFAVFLRRTICAVALLSLQLTGGGGRVDARVSRGAVAPAGGQKAPEQPERMGLWLDGKQVERFAGNHVASIYIIYIILLLVSNILRII